MLIALAGLCVTPVQLASAAPYDVAEFEFERGTEWASLTLELVGPGEFTVLNEIWPDAPADSLACMAETRVGQGPAVRGMAWFARSSHADYPPGESGWEFWTSGPGFEVGAAPTSAPRQAYEGYCLGSTSNLPQGSVEVTVAVASFSSEPTSKLRFTIRTPNGFRVVRSSQGGGAAIYREWDFDSQIGAGFGYTGTSPDPSSISPPTSAFGVRVGGEVHWHTDLPPQGLFSFGGHGMSPAREVASLWWEQPDGTTWRFTPGPGSAPIYGKLAGPHRFGIDAGAAAGAYVGLNGAGSAPAAFLALVPWDYPACSHPHAPTTLRRSCSP